MTSTPPDLRRALALATQVERAAVDPLEDLARAERAAGARRRRRLRGALSGLAAVAVLAVGTGTVVGRDDGVSSAPTSARVELVSARFEAAPYTFDLTPRGWSVQAEQPSAVTIVPDDGSVSADPSDFRGKLVILFDAEPVLGRTVRDDGRAFGVLENGRYTIMSTRTRGGEPAGTVRIQYPQRAGWDQASMLAFLASVHVGPGVEYGLG